MPSTPDLAGVILAGGASSRMGADKAFLLWEGVPLLRRQIDTARAAGARQVWISGRKDTDYLPFGCPVLLDSLPGAGPLAGLVAALRAAQGKYLWLLALAVDLPRMTPEYLGALATESAAGGHALIPQRGLYFEPLAAIYPVASALSAAEVQLAAGRWALQDLAASLVRGQAANPRLITPAERALFANWNDSSGPRVVDSE